MAAHADIDLNSNEEVMTVEQYLEKQFEDMMKDFRCHSEQLISKLRAEYAEGASQISLLMTSHTCKSSGLNRIHRFYENCQPQRLFVWY